MNAREFLKSDYAISAGVLLAAIVIFAVAGHRERPEKTPPLPGDQKVFYRDCVDDVLDGGTLKASCRSFAVMEATYHLDPQNALVAAQAKMANTALRIARGEITSRENYDICVRDGVCAQVPLLPRGADPNSATSRATLAEFWHLAHEGTMTAANCNALDLCRAYVRLGLIKAPPPLAPAAP